MELTSEVLAGSLADMPASVLLRTLARANATGVLRIGAAQPKWAAFAHGDIVLAGVGDRSIADRFRSSGRMTEVDYQQLRRVATHDVLVVEELLRVLGHEGIIDLIEAHVATVIFEMLLPSADPFAFQPGLSIDLAERFAFPVNEAIAQAEQRLRSWVQIAQTVPSVDVVFRLRRRIEGGGPSVSIPAEDWPVLAALDGRRTVSQAMIACGLDTFDFCSAVHRLNQLGLVERSS